MPAGLIDIISFGSQDLFLIGTPQITFYKTVYRRYANFSIESIEIPFDNATGFGQTSNVILKPIGDLIHNIYLKIKLPKIKLDRPLSHENIKNNIHDIKEIYEQYQKCITFMNINAKAYRSAIDIYSASNVINSIEMIDAIISTFSNLSDTEFHINSPFDYIDELKFNLLLIANFYQDHNPFILSKEDFKIILDQAMSYSTKIQLYYDQQLHQALLSYDDTTNKNLKFAWVDRIGNAIIDYVDIYIGSEKIDRHYGIWMNIWYELSGKKIQHDNYMKMIGNIPELTNFNRIEKPEYNLFIPLQFWFNRFNGLSIPIIALQNSHISLSVKFRTFKECAYIEKIQNMDDNFNLNSLCMDNENNYDSTGYRRSLEASLLVDYVYLDPLERKRFAQSSHEYLIEQLQVIKVDDIDKELIKVNLDFIHPCKELIWILQKQSYINNDSGFIKSRWDNYTPNKHKKDFSIDYASIDFHGYSRVDKYNGMYFNYLQPYNYHSNTPDNGINLYSFSLKPEEQQPTGSCNFSRINKAILNLWINPKMFYTDNGQKLTKLNLWVFAKNYNILRIISGIGGVAYI